MKLLRHTSRMQADTWVVQPAGIVKPPAVETGQLCASGRHWERPRDRVSRGRAGLCPIPGLGEVAGEEQSHAVLAMHGSLWAEDVVLTLVGPYRHMSWKAASVGAGRVGNAPLPQWRHVRACLALAEHGAPLCFAALCLPGIGVGRPWVLLTR